MRHFLPISVLALLLSTHVAGAQSGPNRSALDALGPPRPASHPRAHHARHAHHRHAAAAPTTASSAATRVNAALPAIPASPPPPPVIAAPVVNVPLHPLPPPPVPVVAKAAGAASPIARGVSVTFGSDSADLNPTTMQALQDFAATMKSDASARALVDAYCAGTPDDPSTPRRMSLERGLAARAVLIHAGIPSTRIYVRAIGQPEGGGPANRVDLTRSDSTQQTAAAK